MQYMFLYRSVMGLIWGKQLSQKGLINHPNPDWACGHNDWQIPSIRLMYNENNMNLLHCPGDTAGFNLLN